MISEARAFLRAHKSSAYYGTDVSITERRGARAAAAAAAGATLTPFIGSRSLPKTIIVGSAGFEGVC